jgi:cytochrome P450
MMPELAREYGPIVQLRNPGFFVPDLFLVSEPALMNQILKDSRYFRDRAGIFTPFYFIVPKGLLCLPTNEVWALHRKAVVPLLSRKENFVRYAQIINEFSSKMLSKIVPGEEIEVDSLFTAGTLDIISSIGFSYDSNALDDKDSKMIKTTRTLAELSIMKLIFPVVFHLTSARQKFAEAMDFFRDIAFRAINSSTSLTEKEIPIKSEHRSIVEALINNSSGESLAKDEVFDEVMSLLLAGHETTAHTLSWCLLLLAQNPDKQELAFDAVRKVLGRDKFPDFETYSSGAMEYLESITLETLRLYPTLPLYSRYCENGYKDERMQFPPKSLIFLSPCIPGRDPQLWDKADQFIPERFMGLSDKERAELRALKGFAPFGGGKRECVGKSFALFEACTILARFLQRFRFELAPRRAVPKGLTFITLHPEKGLHLIAHARLEKTQ